LANVAAYDKWVLCHAFQAKFVEGLLDMANIDNSVKFQNRKKVLRVESKQIKILQVNAIKVY
jgi:hypothetical protein